MAAGSVLTAQDGGSNLVGGAGDDTLIAGHGPDTLTGAGGADVFRFGSVPWSAGHVTDFTPGTDQLDLSALLSGATVLSGKAATAAAALSALDGTALAHVACHGRFRADSPLFSSLELADGPLNVHDLQRLRRAPEIIVLSSCDVALSERHPGDELLGLAAALLAMGTRTIVASVVPVPDAAARKLMLAFHRELAAGAPPATALARAQAGLQRRSAALAGFVCLGTG